MWDDAARVKTKRKISPGSAVSLKQKKNTRWEENKHQRANKHEIAHPQHV